VWQFGLQRQLPSRAAAPRQAADGATVAIWGDLGQSDLAVAARGHDVSVVLQRQKLGLEDVSLELRH